MCYNNKVELRMKGGIIMKTLLIIIYFIVAIVLTAITLLQSKDDEGASGTITGGSGSFYEKNKGRTKEGKLKRFTIILGIVFILLAIILGIFY